MGVPCAQKQTLFLTLTTAVIFLSIISNLSIMSSSVVCIFALLYVYITNNDYNMGVSLEVILYSTTHVSPRHVLAHTCQ